MNAKKKNRNENVKKDKKKIIHKNSERIREKWEMLSIFVLTFMLTEFSIQHTVCFKDKSIYEKDTQKKPSHSRISRIDFSKQSSDGLEGFGYIKDEYFIEKQIAKKIFLSLTI